MNASSIGTGRVARIAVLAAALLVTLAAAQSKLTESTYHSGIEEIEEFKKCLREPYKSAILYGLAGARGFKDGYFKEYHHADRGSAAEIEKQQDAKCLSKQSEQQIYQIVYFLFNGELIDIGTVFADADALFRDTYNHCAIYETVSKIYEVCTDDEVCSLSGIITNLSSHGFILLKLGESVLNLLTSNQILSALNSPNDLYDLTYSIGEDLGEIIVSMFGV